MIKYNTSDLIKRASQLADLENSDFISWNENIMAINEAYQAVYQKAINRDEKYYLKECVINNPVYQADKVCYELPEDFYQLYAVNDLASNSCIIRNSVNNPVGNKGYNIINNELVIYGANASPISLKYYPVPKTLAYKAKDVPIKLPFNNSNSDYIITIHDVYDRYICYSFNNNNEGYRTEIHTYNWDTGEDKLITYYEDTASNLKVIAGKNCILSTYTDSKQKQNNYIYKYDISYAQTGKKVGRLVGLDSDKNIITCIPETTTSEVIQSESIVTPYSDRDSIFLKSNLLKLFIEFETSPSFEDGAKEFNSYNIILIDNNTIEVQRLKIENPTDPKTAKFGIIVYKCDLLNDEILEQKSESYPYEEALVSPNVKRALNGLYSFYKDGSKYVLSATNHGIDNSNIIIIENDSQQITYGDAIGIMKVDGDTGYGIMCKQGSNAVIKSIFQDTEIDYPNNLFINFLAYKLAMMYKAKQGGDLNGIMIQLQQAEDQFYDSIARDIYSNVRIQNVY